MCQPNLIHCPTCRRDLNSFCCIRTHEEYRFRQCWCYVTNAHTDTLYLETSTPHSHTIHAGRVDSSVYSGGLSSVTALTLSERGDALSPVMLITIKGLREKRRHYMSKAEEGGRERKRLRRGGKVGGSYNRASV